MKRFLRAIYCALISICLLSGCGSTPSGSTASPVQTTPPESVTEPSPTPTPTPKPSPVIPSPKPYAPVYPAADTPMVDYDGIVEHLFFHSAIAYPEQAFDGDSKEKGFDDFMVTVDEFNIIIKSLYDKNFIMVNMNDVWSEYTDSSGVQLMKKNTLRIPEGKIPIIISFDDISYYEYMRGNGFMRKLIIGDDGEIWASGADRDGNSIVTQELDAITLLDKFVEEHPDFSLNGVKGCICLTGYEGILGYHTQTDVNDTSPQFEANRQRERVKVKPVVARLKETGWYFASHSWGHINLNNAKIEKVKKDTDRWLDEVGSLVGETKLYVYPFGSRLDGDDVQQTGECFRYVQGKGFRIFASVGIESYSKIKKDISAVICDRMHADGTTLRYSRERYLIFYDAKDIFDPARPEKYGKSW